MILVQNEYQPQEERDETDDLMPGKDSEGYFQSQRGCGRQLVTAMEIGSSDSYQDHS